MAGYGVRCEQYTVFKNAHPHHRIPGNTTSIESNKTHFCEAFFHVPGVKDWKTEMRCLDKKSCRVYDKFNKLNDRTDYPKLRQPKHVVCFVVLKRGGDVIYKALYENCVEDKKHAEDYFDHDATNGQLKDILDEFERKKYIDILIPEFIDLHLEDLNLCMYMYITLQPCHFSTKQGEKSCTETLIQLYEEKLKPLSIEFVVKPTFIYKAYWKTDQENRIEVEKAKEGLRMLTDKGIEIQAMKEDDWTFLRQQLCPSVPLFGRRAYEKSERQKLDEFIHDSLQGIKREVSQASGSAQTPPSRSAQTPPSRSAQTPPSTSARSLPSTSARSLPSGSATTRQEEHDRENEYENLARNHLRVDNQKLQWKGTENVLQKFLVLFFKDAGKISQENPKDTKVKARFRANDGSIFRWFKNKTLQCQGDNNNHKQGQENKKKLLDLVTRLK